MLHSNLLGRLGNGLLKFIALVVMVCNVSGAFAEPKTISTNTTLSSAKTYDDDVTVNPGVTLTINSEVTIQGNLINNGGTIIVGEGGVLTVNGNVRNTSAYSTTEYSTEGATPSTTYAPSETPSWPEYTNSTSTQDRSRTKIVTNDVTEVPIFSVGLLSITNGGSVTINGNMSNSSLLSIQTTDADNISRLVVTGNFANDKEIKESVKKITTTETRTQQTQTRTRTKKNNGKWRDWVEGSWNNAPTSETSSPFESNGASVSSTTTGTINLSNGYLVVKGSMELQDNSVINYNTASSLGEDIQSSINVSGSVIQAENADINLASNAKGKLIVAETYTDNTTTDGNANHPWSITDEGELVMNSSFDLYATKYVSAKLDAIEDEIDALIASLNTQVTELTGKTLDQYMQIAYPNDYQKYLNNYGVPKKNILAGYRKYSSFYTSFGEYFRYEASTSWGELIFSLGSAVPTEEQYNATASALQAAAIAALQTQINENTTLKATFEALEQALASVGVNSTSVSTQSAAVSALLPIELTSFTATATDYGFEFNWVTASENENDYFTLEYSIDGVDFNEIDYIHGAGTTSETSEYEYRWDEAPEFDVVYFRLKQTDYNGEYSYSDVIVASRKKSSGANGTFRYGPLNLQIQDGELRYIVK